MKTTRQHALLLSLFNRIFIAEYRVVYLGPVFSCLNCEQITGTDKIVWSLW